MALSRLKQGFDSPRERQPEIPPDPASFLRDWASSLARRDVLLVRQLALALADDFISSRASAVCRAASLRIGEAAVHAFEMVACPSIS